LIHGVEITGLWGIGQMEEANLQTKAQRQVLFVVTWEICNTKDVPNRALVP